MNVDYESYLEKILPLLTEYAVSAVGALVFIVVAFLLAGWARRLTVRAMTKAKVEITLAKFFGMAVRWLIIIMALIACLGIFGVQTTSFAAVLGAGSLAVGLAFQGSLSNLACGVMLLLFRPFRVGNVVNIGGHLGKVDEIELFTTRLDTFDNRRIILPNAQVFGAVIENITFHPRRRADVDVGVSYEADIDRTREVLEAAARRVPGGLSDPAPQVVLNGFGASSVDWQVRVWANTAEWLDVKQATIREVKLALDQAGLSIPFPQRDVHFDREFVEAIRGARS